ncbi:bifunctional phosphoglucose/phosphomannose isomerase [Candidatus Oleimmundimicrobium sp.]|uniref:bifunctional phosphoglucose/phosphomannose isomerase n=1 Tax=Candidatus Oleimmundimicrobium sp. TaxID=3060597 RepID=UPI00271DDC6D|nr:bifunctional phosphoglucose/phosphomannose isomerase [Candidatus Oleimmundimicrobium sp.]MDO8886582.1 bifunctional phosphoglucose/phosphomannose isomerase [Candidatus Oleimmundimicrobium sp.]
MIELDDIKAIKKIDKKNMLGALELFPEQCEEAEKIARKTRLSVLFKKPRSIIILGMGGSGISGDIVKAILSEELDIPIFVNKDYKLPKFANKNSLFLAVSYSGNTEETLSAFEQAVSLGAFVISITSGGELAKKARNSNLPVMTIPGGLQPRAALGYLLIPIFVVLEKLGLIKSKVDEIKNTVDSLKQTRETLSPGNPLNKNLAKQLAERLVGKIPVVYGSCGITGVAALRWKCQFNENSKVPAFYNIFPELNHNETVGWELLKDITERFFLIIFKDDQDHPQVKKRIDITKSLIQEHFDSVFETWTKGESKLERIFSIIYLGDFVSTYLAVAEGIDPSPVERISLLKKELAKE